MLVLSRKNDQSVVIQGPGGLGQTVRITLLDTGRGSAKLGFEASRDVLVHREEVWKRIQTDSRQTSDGPVGPKEDLARWEDDGGGLTLAQAGSGGVQSAGSAAAQALIKMER